MTPSIVQRVENAALAALIVVLFVTAGFDWWWLLVWFLVFDLSALGYLRGPRFGAIGYNLVHNYTAPALLALSDIILRSVGEGLWVLGFAAGCWAFHVAADRALGYGLKLADSFQHTHLGRIGRSGE